MGIFSREFKLEKRRLNVLIYGAPKVGKTRAILDLAKKDPGNFVVLMTTDHGTLEVYRNPTLYKGRLCVAEVFSLTDMRRALEEGRVIVRKLIKAGVDPGNIWTVIDTTTHLMIQLLTEARQISLKEPESDAQREYIRDVTTQVDWGILLGLMSECANMLNSYPCNIVNVCLERESRTTKRPEPALSGQISARITGDADLILRMTSEAKAGRKFQTSVLDGAGDRSGVLNETEEPNLIAIRNKIFGPTTTKKESE